MSAGNKITVKLLAPGKTFFLKRSRTPKNKEAVKFRVSDNNLSIPFIYKVDVKTLLLSNIGWAEFYWKSFIVFVIVLHSTLVNGRTFFKFNQSSKPITLGVIKMTDSQKIKRLSKKLFNFNSILT